MSITSNVLKIRQQIAETALKANRFPEEIALVLASKNRDIPEMKEAIEAGIKIIGENRVQEAKRKNLFLGRKSLEWHFIGHLQTNKVKPAVELFHLIQSVDSQRLIEEINQRAMASRKRMKILIEVNIARDPHKYGLFPKDILEFIKRNSTLEGVWIEGLMTIAPWVETEKTRPYFRQMKELFEKVKSEKIPGVNMKWLSMGMTDDFPVAIEEGSNMVRIGRAVFER